jgi:chromatin structure-remodeling complex subunit RSC58
VLKDADKRGVMVAPIPVDFFEKDPSLISQSYSNWTRKDVTTTISDKYDQGLYKSPYSFYHDIRLASFILINDLELGSRQYADVDRFYKLSTELFLRDCYRLHIKVQEFKEMREQLFNDREESAFEDMLNEDFDSISMAYTVGHTELYVTMTQNNVPLFTSMNNRSALDERETILPETVSSSKVIPNAISDRSMPLGSLSPQVSRLPPQNASATQILSRFLHPNWYSLPTAKWLETSDLQSFGPVVDEQTVVVSSAEKGRLWLEHIGYKKLQQWGQESSHYDATNALNGENDADMEEEIDEEDEDEDEDQEEGAEMDIDKEPVQLDKNDYFNIHEWSAYNVIDDEEIKAFEDGTEQQYLSQQLKKLQSLRKQRFDKGLTRPSDKESDLHFRCFRLLKDIMIAGDITPDVKPSPLLPTEQFIYTGSLPVPQQNAQSNYRKKYKTRTR